MKNRLIALLFAAAFFSCSDEHDSSEFVRVYGDVLTARVSHPNSIEAQYAVDSVLEANGHDLQSFGAALERFSTSDPNFSVIIDSLRTAVTQQAARLDSLKTLPDVDVDVEKEEPANQEAIKNDTDHKSQSRAPDRKKQEQPE